MVHIFCLYFNAYMNFIPTITEKNNNYHIDNYYISYFNIFHLSSLNPINIPLSDTNTGLFISIPSLANNSIFSLSLIFDNFSFKFNSLYFNPLVLNHFFISNPLSFIHFVNSFIVGTSSIIFLSSNSILFSSNHFFAFYKQNILDIL